MSDRAPNQRFPGQVDGRFRASKAFSHSLDSELSFDTSAFGSQLPLRDGLRCLLQHPKAKPKSSSLSRREAAVSAAVLVSLGGDLSPEKVSQSGLNEHAPPEGPRRKDRID